MLSIMIFGAILGISNVDAKLREFDNTLVTANDYTPPTWFSLTANATTNMRIIANYDTNDPEQWPKDYPYILMSFCTTGEFTIKRTASAGNSCSTSCFKQDIISFYSSAKCQVDNTEGKMWYVLAPVNKLDVGSGNARYYQLNDQITITNKNNWWNPAWLNGVYMTDDTFAQEAILYANNENGTQLNNLINNQITQQHNDSLAVQSAIGGVTNAIGNMQNGIINEDTTYSNNPSENINGKQDMDDLSDAEKGLINNLDFSGAEDIDITINAESSSFIWQIVNQLRQMNGAIVLLMTSILGLGIIKMILNR